MKLLLCAKCSQIFNLTRTYQECRGGHGGGQYVNELDAKIWGPKKTIFVLGFANSTLTGALRDQIAHGDLPETYLPGYGITSPGRDFKAFVIPESADSIDHSDEKFEPIIVAQPYL